jgi:CheY-like chemotaxis protein
LVKVGEVVQAMATILLVESHRLLRNVAGKWLEDAGHEVIACPGPSGPDSTCLGASGKTCPLERGADLVVVDVDLPGEEVGDGAAGIDLLNYYTGAGKPVVALRAAPDLIHLFSEAAVTELEWPPAREDFLSAVRSALPQV